jgi:hypothetical protein
VVTPERRLGFDIGWLQPLPFSRGVTIGMSGEGNASQMQLSSLRVLSVTVLRLVAICSQHQANRERN